MSPGRSSCPPQTGGGAKCVGKVAKTQIRPKPNKGDARLILPTAQQLQLPQLPLGHSGPEWAAAGDDKLDLLIADARLVIAGLGENVCAVSGHVCTPSSTTHAPECPGQVRPGTSNERQVYEDWSALDYANTGSALEFRAAGASSAGRRSDARGVSPNRPR